MVIGPHHLKDPVFLERCIRAALAQGVYGATIANAKMVIAVSSSHGIRKDGQPGRIKLRGMLMLDRPLTYRQKSVLFLGTGIDFATFRYSQQIYTRVDLTDYGVPTADPFAALRGWVSPAVDGEDFVRVPDYVAGLTDAKASAIFKAGRDTGVILFEEADAAAPAASQKRATRSVRLAVKPRSVPVGGFEEAVEELCLTDSLHDSTYMLAMRRFEETPFDLDRAEVTVVARLTEKFRELLDSADDGEVGRTKDRLDDIARTVGDARKDFEEHLLQDVPRPAIPALSPADATECMQLYFDMIVDLADVRANLWAAADRLLTDERPNPDAVRRLFRAFRSLRQKSEQAVFAPAGVGKTHAYLTALAKALAGGSRLRAAVSVPTHELIGELQGRGRDAGLEIAVYKGMPTACAIWHENDGLVGQYLGAKGGKPCAASCHGHAECEYVAQDHRLTHVVAFAGNDTLVNVVPDAARRPGRDDTLRALAERASIGDADLAIEFDYDFDDVIDVPRGDFDLVVLDETNLPGWMARRSGDDWFKLSDLGKWAATALPAPEGEALTDRQADALGDVNRFLKTAYAYLADYADSGLDATTRAPDPASLLPVTKSCVRAYVKPKTGLKAIVTSTMHGSRREMKEAKKQIKRLRDFNQTLDKIRSFATALGAGSLLLTTLSDDGNAVLHRPDGQRDAVQFNHRSVVDRQWANGIVVISDATGQELLVRQWWPEAEIFDFRVRDTTKHFHVDNGPTYAAITPDENGQSKAEAIVNRVTNFADWRRHCRGDKAAFGAIMPQRLVMNAAIEKRYGQTGWFNGIRGVDRFRHVDELHVVGRLHPGPHVLRWTAAVIFGLDMEAVEGDIALAPSHIMVEDADGTIGYQIRLSYRHPNQSVQAIVDNMIIAELVQAAGRARGIQRPDETVSVFLATISHCPALVYQPEIFDLKNFEDGEGNRRDWSLLKLAMAGAKFPHRRALADHIGVNEDALRHSIKRLMMLGKAVGSTASLLWR